LDLMSATVSEYFPPRFEAPPNNKALIFIRGYCPVNQHVRMGSTIPELNGAEILEFRLAPLRRLRLLPCLLALDANAPAS
jgi:hypothetical protein